MPDYTKNHLTLYTHYRNAAGEFPEALIDPEHHILYLDLVWFGKRGLQFTLAELAFRLRVSVATLASWLDRLGDVMLLTFPHGPRYSEDRSDDPLSMPLEPEGGEEHDFVKDPDVLHDFYRHPFEGGNPLLTPFIHVLYLDLLSVMTFKLPYSLDQIRRALNSPDREVSRRDMIRHLNRLRAIELISVGELSTVSFTSPFSVTVNEPYTAEEMRSGRHRELTQRIIK